MSPPGATTEAATSRQTERREGFLSPRIITREAVGALTRRDGYTTLRENVVREAGGARV